MAFVHTHKDGSFWFTSQDAVPKIDREDMNAMSPGFTSEEVSSKAARNRLDEHWSRQEPTAEEDAGGEKEVKKPTKKDKATPSDNAVVEATPTPEDERAQ
jgi:hypothetical protein